MTVTPWFLAAAIHCCLDLLFRPSDPSNPFYLGKMSLCILICLSTDSTLQDTA